MSFKYQSAQLKTGRNYSFIDEHPSGETIGTILAIHGFPDTAYLWRNLIPHWTQAGYRVIAPDMLGYGNTDKPDDPALYAQKSMSGDIAALLDHLNIHKLILVGHDWGSFFAYRLAAWYPNKVIAVVSLSTPYMPPNPNPYIPLETIITFLPNWGYQLYFNAQESSSEIQANLETFFRLLFQKPPADGTLENPILQLGEFRDRLTGKVSSKETPLILSKEALDHHVKVFGEHGIDKPLTWYRNGVQNYEDEKGNAIPIFFPPNIPVLFVYGALDTTSPPNFIADMPKLISDVKIISLPGVFHWVTEEAGEEVNKLIMEFLDEKAKPRVKAWQTLVR